MIRTETRTARERRGGGRYPAPFPVVVTLPSGRRVRGRLRDIALGGMRLRLRTRRRGTGLAPGARLRVEIRLPDRQRIGFEGVVLGFRPDHRLGGLLAGVEARLALADPSDAARARVYGLLERYLADDVLVAHEDPRTERK